MNALKITFFSLGLLVWRPSAWAQFCPADLDDLAAGEWCEIPNSVADDVDPCPSVSCPPGGFIQIMQAWSGAALDTLRNELVVWGGGHGDYAGNELLGFDLDTRQWRRITDPSPNEAIQQSVLYYSDGLPTSRHSYDLLNYDPTRDRFVSVGVGSRYGNGNGGPSVDEFDLSAGTWHVRTPIPTEANGTFTTFTARHPITGKIYFMGSQSNSARLSAYSPSTDTWEVFGATDYVKIHMSADIDPVRNILVAAGRDEFLVFDLDQPDANPTTPSANGPQSVVADDGPGFVFHPPSSSFVGWTGGNELYRYDPDTENWSTITPNNSVTPGEGYGQGTYGRFAYSEALNVFVLVPRIDKNVFVFKMDDNPGPSLPEVTLMANPSTIAAGETSTLSWTVSNADSCTASGAWAGDLAAANGSEAVSPESSSTFVLNCTGEGGTSGASVTVMVQGASSVPNPPTELVVE